MIALLLPAALAAEPPPPHVTEAALEDTRPWEDRARALLDGPGGCVQLRGEASFRLALYLPGGWLSPGQRKDLVRRGTFLGTLDGGTWTSLAFAWEDGDGEGLDGDALDIDELQPIVGRVPPDPEEEEGGSVSIGTGDQGTQVAITQGSDRAVNMLDGLIEEIDPQVTTAYAAWEGDSRSVVLRQFVPMDQGGDLEIQVLFPEGGAPTSLDAVFPRRIRFREGPLTAVIRDAQLHLRGQVTPLGVLPGEEGVSMVIGALGFTFGFEQRLSYTGVRSCPS